MNANSKFTIYDMCSIGIFTAIISILAQIAIPMPSAVPFTLQTFAITLTAVVLGSQKGTAAVFVYLLLGAVGVPVFSHFRGGLQAFTSPTGGFLISFPIMSYCIGLGTQKKVFKGFYPLMLILGNVINYLFGIAIYCFSTESTFMTAFLVCVVPFIPSTIITSVLASIVGFKIHQRINSL